MSEKKKMLFHRIFWLVLVLLGAFLPSIIESFRPKLKIVNYECYVSYYYETLNSSSCEVKIEFNRSVWDFEEVKLAFYDANGDFIEVVEEYFFVSDNNDKIIYNDYISVDGKVDSFEIISHSFTPMTCIWPYLTLIISIPMLISALLLSYKEVEFNGKKISVYAGFYHHRLRVDGELCDEHNTLKTWSAIKLSTLIKKEDGETDNIEATISLTNRIAIKANGKLVDNKHIIK